MTVEVHSKNTNVVALNTKPVKAAYWTISQHFHEAGFIASANDDYAPAAHEGAQTSDHLLDFLYGVAR